MKQKFLFLLGLMFTYVNIVHAANTLKVQGVEMTPGESISLSIELNNTTRNLMGWQCDIVLPNGLSLALKSNGKPIATLGSRFSTTEHTISSNVLSNGSYRFIATSMDGEAIPGTSGTLFSVTLQADASLKQGTTLTGKIQNIELNTQDNQKLTLNDVSFTVSIPAASGIDITKYISAASTGGAVMQTNDLINSGSQLGWRFSNSSSVSVTLKSMQLIDGKTGTAGNIMSVNTVVEAGKAVGYTTTIGASGIHTPVTCRFRYDYNGVEYSVDAVYKSMFEYTLSIKASGNGSVTYSGSTMRNSSKSFTVDRYGSATITFNPDNGYRIKSVRVNSSDVTSSVANNKYTISSISKDTNVEVEFEEIPTTYTLSVTASGNGTVTYDGNTICNKTNTYSLNKGTAITLSISPDLGHKISMITEDGNDVSSKVKNGKYEISSISKNTTIEVGFTPNKYKLTYMVDDVVYKSYEIEYGATISPEPYPTKEGYSFSGWSEIPSTMPAEDVTVTGTFTYIPPIEYTLSITSTGSGYVTYSGTTIKGTTKTFTVDENASATITITPDNGYRIKSVMMNGTVVTSQLSGNQFVINAITTDTDIKVTFEAEAPSIDITKYISVSSAGGTIMQTNDLINYGSQLSWRFSNRSEVDVTLKSMQLIDGKTGQAGNIMSVNTVVEAGQAVGYTTTIGLLGIHTPVTCRFRYEYNGVEYSADAIYKSMYEYELTINVSGNGSVTYNGSTIRNSSKSVIVDRYDSATLSFAPDEGYRIKSVIVNGSDVTSSVANNKYTISSISKDTNIKVEFEAIPPSYTLSIKASGNGSVIYDNNTIRSKTSTFSVEGGTAVTLSISPDLGHKMNMVTENGNDVSSKVKDGKYEIGSMSKNTTIEVGFVADIYKLIYMVDGVEYKTIEVEYGTTITPEAGPTKDGYSFSGWKNLPSTMPAHDVTVTGAFMPNKYKLTYLVDGQTYKTLDVEFGAIITPEAAPTKEGYTFSGWNEVPEKMPDMDVTVTGTFTINKYKLIYLLNGEEYKVYELEYGSSITPETAPTKEGYTFSGWNWIPTKMPAEDVTITGSLTANKYKLTYMVDGMEYKSYEVDYGSSIIPEAELTKEGYTFSGWSWIPSKMPDEDVMVTGSFTINKYKLTYLVDGKVYKTYEVEYGSTIIPEPQPEGDYVRFAWVGIPDEMPAHDVTVTADFETGIMDVIAKNDIKYIYGPNGKRVNKLQKGVNIVVMKDGTTRKIILKSRP